MWPRTLLLGLVLAGSLQAAVITVRVEYMDLSGPGSDDYQTGVTSIPLSGDLGDGDWTFTAAVTTNLVPIGGGVATADGSLDVHFTDATLTCVNSAGCGSAYLSFDMRAAILNPWVLAGYDVSLQGTGPDISLSVNYDGYRVEPDISGPTYSFHQSGLAPPSGNFYLNEEIDLYDSYTQGTVLSLPDSLDFTLNTVPEPASFGLMAAGIGLVGWRLRRRRKPSA